MGGAGKWGGRDAANAVTFAGPLMGVQLVGPVLGLVRVGEIRGEVSSMHFCIALQACREKRE